MIKTKIIREFKTVWVDVECDSGLTMRLSAIGAGVYSIIYKGKRLSLVLAKPEEYLHAFQFFGKTLARVAGRIPCNFKVGNKKLNLPEEVNGFCLHGGNKNSLSFKEWTPSILCDKTHKTTSAAFIIHSPDGDCGFPGNVTAKVIYEFKDDGKPGFAIKFEVISDQDTPFSFSNHIYWDLYDDNNISDEILYMNADRIGTDSGKSQLITGIGNIPDCMDFRKPSKLSPKLYVVEKTFPTKTIDHTFLYVKADPTNPQASIENSQIKVSLYTDFEAMNIYVDNSLTPIKFLNGSDMSHPRRAIALEPQIFLLDTNKLIIKKDQLVSHFISYEIKEKN